MSAGARAGGGGASQGDSGGGGRASAGGEAGAGGAGGAGAAASLREAPYEVFARKKRGDALRHVGCVDAPDDVLARVYAWTTYDEENWFEMCVAPRSALVRAGPASEPARPHAGGDAARDASPSP